MTEARETILSVIQGYSNTAEQNDRIHEEFTRKTDSIDFLRSHRDHIERYKLGFGDRAFHYMWYLLVRDAAARFGKVNALEIGVYKGQVISLWSLLAKKLDVHMSIQAITPLSGNEKKSTDLINRIANKFRRIFDSSYRKCVAVGNNYPEDNYEQIVRNLFADLQLDFGAIRIHKGFSNDQNILTATRNERFHLIYIDGDHSFEGVTADIHHFAPLVHPGGYMVMDDASFFLPGTRFWKGHEEVAKACEIIEGLGFTNILNVGHNRIYRKK